MGISFTEYLIIGIVALLLYGPNKLPEIGKSLGKMIHEFKKSLNESQSNEPASSSVSSAAVQTSQEESKPQDHRRLPD